MKENKPRTYHVVHTDADQDEGEELRQRRERHGFMLILPMMITMMTMSMMGKKIAPDRPPAGTLGGFPNQESRGKRKGRAGEAREQDGKRKRVGLLLVLDHCPRAAKCHGYHQGEAVITVVKHKDG